LTPGPNIVVFIKTNIDYLTKILIGNEKKVTYIACETDACESVVYSTPDLAKHFHHLYRTRVKYHQWSGLGEILAIYVCSTYFIY
jgi:hypothetical protein